MLTIATLGSYRDNGYSLTAFCEASLSCSHYASLDIGMLIAKFGEGFDVPARRAELLSHLRCSACGGKNMAVHLVPPDVYAGHQGHSLTG